MHLRIRLDDIDCESIWLDKDRERDKIRGREKERNPITQTLYLPWLVNLYKIVLELTFLWLSKDIYIPSCRYG